MAFPFRHLGEPVFTKSDWGSQLNYMRLPDAPKVINLGEQKKIIESLIYKNTLLEREVERLSRMVELIAVHNGLENIIDVPLHSTSRQQCHDQDIICYFCQESADNFCSLHDKHKSTHFTVFQNDKIKYYVHNCCLDNFKNLSTHPLSEAKEIGNHHCKN